MNQKTTLYYRRGSSDKVYQAEIVEVGADLYKVAFAYGRRGGTLQAGYKTISPVSFSDARKIFDNLVQSKISKGYTNGEDGTPYLATPNEARVSGIYVQLLNAIDQDQLASYLADPHFGAQEKYDGKRMIVKVSGGRVEAINRNGLFCGLPQTIQAAAAKLAATFGDLVIDGEAIGDTFFAFDALLIGGRGLSEKSFIERFLLLAELTEENQAVIVAPLATDTAAKQRLFSNLVRGKREGIVFKRLAAPYRAGRPSSGGDQLKFKFQAEATCVVSGINDTKRSVSLAVLGERGTFVNVGNCTIPPNKEIPSAGCLVEIRYLNFMEGGSLFQPFFKYVRDDKSEADLYSSLKRKPQIY